MAVCSSSGVRPGLAQRVTIRFPSQRGVRSYTPKAKWKSRTASSSMQPQPMFLDRRAGPRRGVFICFVLLSLGPACVRYGRLSVDRGLLSLGVPGARCAKYCPNAMQPGVQYTVPDYCELQALSRPVFLSGSDHFLRTVLSVKSKTFRFWLFDRCAHSLTILGPH